MECLYQKEHAGCINYVSQEKEPAIKIIRIDEGGCIYEHPGIGRLVILLKGEIRFSFSSYNMPPMQSRQMLFLPVGCGMNIIADEDSCLILVRLDKKIHFCDSFRMEQLASCIQTEKSPESNLPVPHFLSVDAIIESILYQVKEISETGYTCRVYFEMKTEELLMMMRFCYTKYQLACFFREIVSVESHFAYKIVHHYHRFRTLSELAAFMGMTLTTFERHFRRIFGKSGHKWMNDRKVQKIYHAITSGDENFKELSFQFGFSSPAAFNDYCKMYLGYPPGKIRQKAKATNEG